MQINPITFKGNIRIKLQDKSMLSPDDIRNPTPMSTIRNIAENNGISMFVGEDVILLGSSKKVQKQLNEVGIVYTVENSSKIDCGGSNGKNSKIKDNYKRM